MMDFDANSLILSTIISSIGFVAFMYGKKQQRFPQVISGLVLMVYPYFVSNLWAMGGIAVAILVLLWAAIQRGY